MPDTTLTYSTADNSRPIDYAAVTTWSTSCPYPHCAVSPPPTAPPSMPPAPPPPRTPQLISRLDDFASSVTTAMNAPGQLVEVHLEPGGYSLIAASEVWIFGEPSSTLQAEGSAAALVFHNGAPRVNFRSLNFAGLAIRVEGGDLAVEDCNFTGKSAGLQGTSPEPRALTIVRGTVRILDATFSHFDGGAIAVMAGRLDVDAATLHDNSAATGGALLVTGGWALLKRVVFRNNMGKTSGGALQVDDGVVELAQQTRFVTNWAPQGASLYASSVRTVTRTGVETELLSLSTKNIARAISDNSTAAIL
eukprot:7389602-Prymnesium_polylepis.1